MAKKPDELPDNINFNAIVDVFEATGMKEDKGYYWAKESEAIGLEDMRRRGYVVDNDPEVKATFAKGDSSSSKVLLGENKERYVLMSRPKELSIREKKYLYDQGIGRIKGLHSQAPGAPFGEIKLGDKVLFSRK